MYASRKEGGRGLASVEDCADISTQGLNDYFKSKERLIITTSKSNSNIRINRKTAKTKT